jgi:hypothetical protein
MGVGAGQKGEAIPLQLEKRTRVHPGEHSSCGATQGSWQERRRLATEESVRTMRGGSGVAWGVEETGPRTSVAGEATTTPGATANASLGLATASTRGGHRGNVAAKVRVQGGMAIEGTTLF